MKTLDIPSGKETLRLTLYGAEKREIQLIVFGAKGAMKSWVSIPLADIERAIKALQED